jgi:hypothetical protein
MSWKKRDPVAGDLISPSSFLLMLIPPLYLAEHTWELLRASNQGLAETFAELTRLSKADSLKYDQEVEELSKVCANQVRVYSASANPNGRSLITHLCMSWLVVKIFSIHSSSISYSG